MKSNPFKLRVSVICFFFAVIYLGICSKAVYLHLYQGAWLSQKATGQLKKTEVTNGKRGTIYDRNHHEMAVSIDMTSIGAFPGRIEDQRETARTLAPILKMNRSEVLKKINAKKSFVWLQRQVEPEAVQKIKEMKIAGLDFIPEHSRVYPNKTLAAQLLGFSGVDGHGLEGIEFFYNDYLKGGSNEDTVYKDALGRKFDCSAEAPLIAGNNLILTIDRTIQYIAETALKEAVDNSKAQSGMAVVMQPHTGAILALAHYPFFNPNAYRQFSCDKWRNRAITDPYEPGSTMKIFLAAGAIESGRCSPSSIFYCEEGKYRIDHDTVHDTHSYGWMSLQQIIKYSSNIGSVKIGQKIGRKTLYQTLRDFGFGQETGIDCPGESAGMLSPYNQWSKIDAGTIAFGQGISVTALQLANAASAIANGGNLMKPYIIQAITDENGRLIKASNPQVIRRAVSESTANHIRHIMRSVTTEGGTGVNAALESFDVCGKTGTAQKLNKHGRYAHGKYIASFVGFAPAQDPKLTVLVIVDEPKGQYYGGTVAAPAFKKIIQEGLIYLNISPRRNNQMVQTDVNNYLVKRVSR